jgi:hypothetical protein
LTREREKNTFSVVPLLLRDREYWDRLTDWAHGESADSRSRMALVVEHRRRIRRITERMVLPRDYVEHCL